MISISSSSIELTGKNYYLTRRERLFFNRSSGLIHIGGILAQMNLLRTLVIIDKDRPVAIVPLVVRREHTRVGRLRTLTYPLDNWGSFYGPVGSDPYMAIRVAMDHINSTPRDWDMIELRWVGAPGTDSQQFQNAMRSAGFQAYQHALESNSGCRFFRWLGRISSRTKGNMVAPNASNRRKTISTRENWIYSMPTGKQDGRRWRSTLGLIRCLRNHCPQQLAGNGHRWHYVIA